jgi:phosphatidylglycerol---prolipoprotein diacylglyceryl transferase
VYPLLQLGPLNLSTGGLLLLLAAVAAFQLALRAADRRGGPALAEQVEAAALPVALGALLGGRLWYGLFNWDLYGPNPGLFLAPRIADLAWPGALLGGALACWLWARHRSDEPLALADAAALALPAAHAIASVGLLLSGEAFGQATNLPWGIPLFGAVRHPTQLYYALAALVSWALLARLGRSGLAPGLLFAAYLGLQGVALLLVEALRADPLLLPGGVRAGQVLGLSGMALALLAYRGAARNEPPFRVF